ncbi:MAG: hypothetical protein ACOYLK_17205 [Sphingomonas sp.]
MAILSIPVVGLSLLPHSSGGVLLANSAGYIANTFVSAEIVSAFSTGAAALAKIGAVGASVATSPAAVAAATIAVVAVGTYCYFHGIPAPIAEMLSGIGVGSASHAGFMIPVPQLAVALVILGGAGYVYYKFYENEAALETDALRSANPKPQNAASAKSMVEQLFGKETWSKFGAAAWSSMGDAAEAALKAAEEAVEAVSDLADRTSKAGASAAGAAAEAASRAAGATAAAHETSRGLIVRLFEKARDLFKRRVRPTE